MNQHQRDHSLPKKVINSWGKTTWTTAKGATSSEERKLSIDSVIQANTAQQCTKKITHKENSVVIDHPTGVIETLTQADDPRFGEEHKFTKKIETKFPGGRVVTIENDIQYNLDGDNPLKVKSITTKSKLNDKQESTRYYDVETGELTVTSPMGLTSTTNYNDAGRVSQTTVPGFYPTSYIYDDDGRLMEMTQHERSVRYAYNDKGYLESVTDHTGRKTEYTYDEAGRVTETKLPDGHIVYKAFDKGSNVTEIDPDYPHGYGYTDIDQVDVYTEPEVDGKVYQTKYLYDLDGAVTSVTRPDQSEITYDYEETTRRLKQVNTPDGAVVYDYDSDTGLLTSVTFGSESVSYVYDGSLTTSETVSGEIEGTVSWTYNQELLVDSITVNNESVSYQFNDDGALTKAGDVSLSYLDTTGQLTGITQGDFKEDYTFTLYGELESYTITQADSVIYKEELIYDAVGRIKTNTITRGSESYVEEYKYDLRGRLEKVFKDGVEQVGYTFDNNSNRLTETRGGDTISGVYDKQDRLKTYGDLSFSYTDNGDVKTKVHSGGTDTYHYDAFGNMTQVDLADGRVLTYKMDARDRRVAKLVNGVVVQRMIYKDQLNPVAILDSENNVETLFVYGSKSNVPNYMIKNGEKYQYITDHKGSVLQVIKMSDGSIAQEITYDFWGNVLSDTDSGFQPFYYVGGLYDVDTKLIKFGVRSYDPEVGRWMQKEPLGFAGALNFYAYCKGEPVNWVDVNGLAAVLAPLVPVLAEGGKRLIIWGARKVIKYALKAGIKSYTAQHSLESSMRDYDHSSEVSLTPMASFDTVEDWSDAYNALNYPLEDYINDPRWNICEKKGRDKGSGDRRKKFSKRGSPIPDETPDPKPGDSLEDWLNLVTKMFSSVNRSTFKKYWRRKLTKRIPGLLD